MLSPLSTWNFFWCPNMNRCGARFGLWCLDNNISLQFDGSWGWFEQHWMKTLKSAWGAPHPLLKWGPCTPSAINAHTKRWHRPIARSTSVMFVHCDLFADVSIAEEHGVALTAVKRLCGQKPCVKVIQVSSLSVIKAERMGSQYAINGSWASLTRLVMSSLHN